MLLDKHKVSVYRFSKMLEFFFSSNFMVKKKKLFTLPNLIYPKTNNYVKLCEHPMKRMHVYLKKSFSITTEHFQNEFYIKF